MELADWVGKTIKCGVLLMVTVSAGLYAMHFFHGADFGTGFRMVSNDYRVFGECPTKVSVQREMLFRQPLYIFGEAEVWDGEIVKEVCQ